MIKINIINNNNLVEKISIKGHAEYDLHGSDIVCSAVSSIAITTVNGIMKIDKECIDFIEEEGYLEIQIKKHTVVSDSLINNMIDLLVDLEKQYKKNIKIIK